MDLNRQVLAKGGRVMRDKKWALLVFRWGCSLFGFLRLQNAPSPGYGDDC
jgi:hypothetical protein